jgi:ribosomal protein S18 acetylase RimI-like enzyme
VEIRTATAEDIAGMLDMWRRAEAAPSVTDTADDLARVISNDRARVLVATDDDGTIIGSLIVTFDGWRAHVYRMAVDRAFQRRGLARRLVDEGEVWLRLQGARRLSALVEGDRPIAQAFWAAAGFELHEGMLRYVKSP